MVRVQQQGLGKPIISAKVNDYQLVGVGNQIHYSKGWRFFSDFLFDYIKHALGNDWGNQQIAKPLHDRHPIMQWYDGFCRFQKSQQKQRDGTYAATLTGVGYCYIGLAYNLYLLKHNAELQARLIARLKNREQFQGAYYELLVANCLIRAGFALTLEDETDSSSKHCEFAAVSDRSGKKYWVEAKMRSVAGLLGKTSIDGASPSAKPTSRLSAHLKEALAKPAQGERLIFIDLNAPAFSRRENVAKPGEIPRSFEAAGQQLRDRERALKVGERAYVFVTNMAFHWDLDGTAPGRGVMAYGLGIDDFRKSGQFLLSELWRQKQKHIDAHHILEAFSTYPNIPSTFDGNLPLSTAEAENRIEVGRTYFFGEIGEKGLIGRVTTAIISEDGKKMYVGVMTEEGKSCILTRDVTEEEWQNYKEHPEAYFGVVTKQGGKKDDPYDFFEWLLDAYKDAPKERLLTFCKDAPDLESLKELEQPDLVLEVCERWTASVMALSERKRSGDAKDTASLPPSQ